MKFPKRTGKSLVAGGTPRVNLMPPLELEKRSRQLIRKRYYRAFYWTIVALVVEASVALGLTALGNVEQAAADRTTRELQSELAKYSMVIHVRSQVRSLEELRAQAGSNDQDLLPLIAEIRAVLPKGVGLIGFTLAPGAAPKPGADASAQVGLRGTLTFSAGTTAAQAETITKLRRVGTVVDVDAAELSSNGPAGGFTFVTTFSTDQTRYSGQFGQKGGK
ncbi:MAG: hypothetical protein ACOH1Y_06180 [Propionicimonas sp.]